MGWTHHWSRPTELPQDRFAAAVADCLDVLPRLGVALAGFDGTGDPILDGNRIVFNGVGGASCEPFEIASVEFDRRGRNEFWSSCKTEHQPYDLCVQACLVILKHHLGDRISVTSDGTDKDWAGTIERLNELLDYGDTFRLDDD